MNLVIVYGQEATGKLTIAKALETITGYKLFHNHMSIDVAKTLFEYGDPAYDELVFRVRLLVLESAAINDIPGLIFTWAYTHPECKPQLDAISKALEPYDVDIRLVFVHCSQDALEGRVSSPDRTELGKIDTILQLHRQQKQKNCIEIPNAQSLVLDNTHLGPREAALTIADKLGLLPASA